METFFTVMLGSGIGAAIVTALIELWRATREKKTELLQQQLSGLYGPLYYFTSQNQALFDLYQKYHEGYDKKFANEICADFAHAEMHKAAESYLQAANAYIDQVVKNDQEVMELLKQGWQHIDADDVAIFSEFQIDYMRLLRSKQEDVHTILVVHEHIGNISFMRPEMIKRVKDKFENKRSQIERLNSFFGMNIPNNPITFMR
ncbi:MAG: hypothetical protein AB7T27_05915 [Kiritimatiellia bacterium]